jgi:LacI family transcriptional regulator
VASRPSIADLAREAQVSVSTIDRILSGRGHVKPTTIEHVLAAAERIGFHGLGTIRGRLSVGVPERTFGFLLNGGDRRLYKGLAEQLTRRTQSATAICGRARIRHLEDLSPGATAEALLELGAQCDAVAGVCIDHPQVNIAVAQLASRKVPVLPMLTDLTSPLRSGFIGSNDWQLGRTAGWFMQRLCPAGGKLLILVGSDRYLCQQSCEASFRSFARSAPVRLEVLETALTWETDATAREVMSTTLDHHPDLAGVLVAGGGLDGAVAALKERRRTGTVVVGTEFTDRSQLELASGSIDVILAHPVAEIADLTVQALIGLTGPQPTPERVQHIVPFQVWVSENC